VKRILLHCENPDCDSANEMSCKDTDQVFICGSCNSAVTFVNLGQSKCRSCTSSIELSLASANAGTTCSKCRTFTGFSDLLRTNEVVRVWRPKVLQDHDGQYMICMAQYFDGLEDEVERAKRVFAKIEKGGWFRKPVPGRRGMFVRIVERPVSPSLSWPIKRLRTVHAYCNFKRDPRLENCKYSGMISAFSDGHIFDELVAKYGLVDVWFADAAVKSEFETFPIDQSIKDLYKLAP
jgi:hypothetical protein